MQETWMESKWREAVFDRAPAPGFPRWIDRVLTPIAGPHLSWWAAALRMAFVFQAPFLIFVCFVLLVIIIPSPWRMSALVEMSGAIGPNSNTLEILGGTVNTVILAPLIENFALVSILLTASAFRISAFVQSLIVAALAWCGHLVSPPPGPHYFHATWAGLLFFAMSWMFRTWAPEHGRQRTYFVTAAAHGFVNGLALASAIAMQRIILAAAPPS